MNARVRTNYKLEIAFDLNVVFHIPPAGDGDYSRILPNAGPPTTITATDGTHPECFPSNKPDRRLASHHAAIGNRATTHVVRTPAIAAAAGPPQDQDIG